MTKENRIAQGDRLFETLASISQLLKHTSITSAGLTKIMEIIAEAVGAENAGLYYRRYDSHDRFLLKRLAASVSIAAELELAFPLSLSIEEAVGDSWNQMNANKLMFVEDIPCSRKIRWLDACINPVDSDAGAYGFIVLTGITSASMAWESFRWWSLSVSNMFSLWVDRGNIIKRFEDVFESFPNPSFIMTADERIAYWNRANEELTGWPAGHLKGKNDYTSSLPYYSVRRPMVANLIMNPDAEWQATYFEFSQDGDRVSALAFCPGLPGGGGYLRTNTLRLYDVNNRLWGAIHAVRDVTIERKMRENLERSESMYRAIADFAGVGILLLSGDQIIYANERFGEFIGNTPELLSLSLLRSWIKPRDFDSFDELINQLLFSKVEPRRFEFQTEQDGEIRYFNALAQLISYSGQDVIHFVIDDVSKQKELDRRARSNELKLFHEERLTSLGIMAAGIAHELNQPLNTIRVITDGFLFCQEKGWGMDRDELHDNIEMVSKQVVRMSSVIQTIRNFARDDLSQEFTDVYINSAVDNVFSMIGRQLLAHNITVEKNLATLIPPVKAPENRLEQVVTNLLINARQAFDTCCSDNCHIWITTGVMDDTVFLEVSDNATGIPDSLLKKIFYPFFTTKQVGKGTGLGLSICQSIVASMNGKLDVCNNSMGGATFKVLIPLP